MHHVRTHPACAGLPFRAAQRRGREVCCCAERTRRLPNGLVVHFVSAPDVGFLYQEVFVERCYEQQGVSLKAGDTVLDVGANVGFFALYAAAAVSPGGRVVCCEPAPAAFDALRRTLAANQSLLSAVDVRALNLGLSDGSQTRGGLTVYPRAAGWSSMEPDDAEVRSNVAAFASAALPTALGALWPAMGRRLAPLLARLQRTVLLRGVAGLVSSRLLGNASRVEVQLTTVSDLIDAMDAHLLFPSHPLALLKIDVERHELEVLRGVRASHWPRILQVAAEVHDREGRLAQVLALLRAAGFTSITAVQPASMKDSNLYNVYAHRG